MSNLAAYLTAVQPLDAILDTQAACESRHRAYMVLRNRLKGEGDIGP